MPAANFARKSSANRYCPSSARYRSCGAWLGIDNRQQVPPLHQTRTASPAGSLSHLRLQLSPGGSHGVRTFPHGFVLSESACCKSLSQKSKIFASSLWQGSLWRRPWAFPFYAPNIISLAKYQSSITAQTAPSPDGRRLWGRCVKKDRCETHVLQRSILCYTCWAAFSSSSFSSWV